MRTFPIIVAVMIFAVANAQAMTSLAPAVLTSTQTEAGMELSWTILESPDAIHLHSVDGNGSVQTIDLEGNATGYVVTPSSQFAFWVTYTVEQVESLPSNPVTNYPPCPELIGMDNGIPPIFFYEKCACPMPVVDTIPCKALPELFR